MKMSRALIVLILTTATIGLVVGFTSCTNIAKFTIAQAQPVSKSQFTRVVVVPLPSINRMPDNELLSGERVISDRIESIFKSASCQVIRTEQVRNEMKIASYAATVSIAQIARKYNPDGVIYVEFQNLVKSGGFGNLANGYFEGDVIVNLLDGTGKPLIECTGYAHAETGAGFPPDFDFLISKCFDDLEPKLLAVLE